jgi:hypothetical protein
MSSRAVAVVEEFLRSSDPRIAENAVVALGSLRTIESLQRLVSVSLDGRTRALRLQAMDLLAHMDKQDRETALSLLQDALDDPERQSRAYAVLGRLRERGWEVGLTTRSWRERWRLASNLAVPRRKPIVMLEAAVRGGTVGLGMGVLSFIRLDHNPRLETVILVGLAALLLSVAVAALASRRSASLDRYPDPVAGIACETAKAAVSAIPAAVAGAFVALLVLLLSVSAIDFTLGRAAAAATGAFLLVVATTALARAGTLLSRGAVRGPVANVWLQSLTGAALAALFLTGAALTAVVLAGEDRAGNMGLSADLLWLVLLPVCAATGHVFGVTDRMPGKTVVPAFRAASAAFAGLVLLTSAAALVYATGREPALERGVVGMHGGELVLRSAVLPARWELQLREGRDSVLFVAEGFTADPQRDIMVTLQYPPPSTAKLVGDDPDLVEGVLKPARYWVSLSEFGLEEGESAVRTSLIPRDLLRRLFLTPSTGTAGEPENKTAPFHLRVRTMAADVAVDRRDARAAADSAYRLAGQGTVLRALEILRPVADGPGREVIPAAVYDRLCWRGSLAGLARQVLGYCNRAVAMEPGNSQFIDSRGLARALTGDSRGAIEDFRHSVRTGNDMRRQIREGFVRKLQLGQPLTASDLEPLRMPYSAAPRIAPAPAEPVR